MNIHHLERGRPKLGAIRYIETELVKRPKNKNFLYPLIFFDIKAAIGNIKIYNPAPAKNTVPTIVEFNPYSDSAKGPKQGSKNPIKQAGINTIQHENTISL